MQKKSYEIVVLSDDNLEVDQLDLLGGELLNNVTTDAITPIPDVLVVDREMMRRTMFGGLREWKGRELEPGKRRVLVAGENFGIGSSRENSAEVMKLNGVEIVMAESFGPIFKDNLINQGIFPVSNFDLLEKIIAGEDLTFEELTEGLSEVQKAVLRYGGLPGYMRGIKGGEIDLPQAELEENLERLQTSIEKMISQRVGIRGVGEGQSVLLTVDELVGYDVFVAHALAVVEREFGEGINVDAGKIHFFNDHFRDRSNPNVEQAVGVLEDFWRRNPASPSGDEGVYMKQMAKRLAPGSMVIGMDSHTPELAVVPGVHAAAVGYTAFAAALATERRLAYTVPSSLKLDLVGELPMGIDIKDAIWFITRKHFVGSKGNGKLFEIGGVGYEKLMHSEAAKVCNAVTEWGGKEAVVTAFNPQVSRYLRTHGSLKLTDEELEEMFEELEGDGRASYADEVVVDLAEVEPCVVGPVTHKKVRTLSELMGETVKIDRVVLASCAGSSLLDLAILVEVLEKRKAKVPVGIHLADPLTRHQAKKLGIWEKLERLGVELVDDHSCGPCMGQGPLVVRAGETVLATSNRNYPGRMGDEKGEVYLASASVAAVAVTLGRVPTMTEWERYVEVIAGAKALVVGAKLD